MFKILRSPEGGEGGGEGGEVKFTPEQQKAVDRIIASRLARAEEKYADYPQLKEKVSKWEQTEQEKQQKELEAQKQWEKLKEGYEGKIRTFGETLSAKDKQIESMTIDHNLTNEISKQNGYVEESLALLRGSTVLKDGKVYVKGKDSNNLDTELPVEEGVKNFLKNRPHLVRASTKGGGGTPPAGGGGNGGEGGGGGGGEDLNALNLKLAAAIQSGNKKEAKELRLKVTEILKSKGQLAGRS